MTDSNPAATPASPRRLAPQLGPLAWTGETLSGSDYMLPLGAEHAAELRAAGGAPAPRLEVLAAALRERLDHGLGFALLRGLPRDDEGKAALHRLAAGLSGKAGPLPPAFPDTPPDRPPGCSTVGGATDDVLLLRAGAAGTAVLVSAAELHNRLLVADRATLAALYAPDEGGGAGAVFALRDNVFAARQVQDHPALPALLRSGDAVALRLPLRAGDVLALNPLLVWHEALPAGAVLRLPGVSGRCAVFPPSPPVSGDGQVSEPPTNPQVGG